MPIRALLLIGQCLLPIVVSTSLVPSHFRTYPVQTGYDVQNPYSYPLRNSETPPCSHASPMFDNKTNLGAATPNQSGPPSSISYVPVQIAAPSEDPLKTSTNIQRQIPITSQKPNYPQMNGHLAAQQQRLQAAQYPTHDSSRPVVSQPTYNAEMQAEIQRQQLLMAAQLAEHQRQKSSWQTSLPSMIPASTTISPSTHPTLIAVATTPSSAFLTPKSDFHALSQLSPDELAAYANRLRSQFQQEKQISAQPTIPNSKFETQNLSPAIPPTNFVTQIPNLPTMNPAIPNVGSISSGGIRGKINASPNLPPKNLPLPIANIVDNEKGNLSVQLPIHPGNGTPSNFTLPQPMLPVQLPFQPAPKLTHEINYCDRRQFDDDKLAELYLKRSDYFIYNTSCAGIFFQCAIGQTFVLKCPSVEGQAFDPAISSCNFKNSVRFCPEYDHVLHCTIRETCSPNEFACCALPQQCIEFSRRCDGHRGKCISAKLRCDGKPDDCGDGSNLDEIGCSKNETCLGKFVCESPQTLALMKHSVCIDIDKYCDNQKDCPGGEDELDCRQNDSEEAKYLSCENQKQQVRKNQWCDGREDCLDGSDEKYCF